MRLCVDLEEKILVLDAFASNVDGVNGGLIKIRLLLMAGIFFAGSLYAVELKVPATGPFMVTVTAAAGKVQPDKTFTLHLKVRNVSKTRQSFETLACAWYVNWTMESDHLQFPTWDCEFRAPYKVSLAPGASWTNDLVMAISKSIPTNRVTFRAGFSPEIVYPNRDKKLPPPIYYWSKPVTLEVVK